MLEKSVFYNLLILENFLVERMISILTRPNPQTSNPYDQFNFDTYDNSVLIIMSLLTLDVFIWVLFQLIVHIKWVPSPTDLIFGPV